MTWNCWKFCRRRSRHWGIPHVDEESSLIDNLGATRSCSKDCSPGCGGVVDRHLILVVNDNPPGRNILTSCRSSGHWWGGHDLNKYVRLGSETWYIQSHLEEASLPLEMINRLEGISKGIERCPSCLYSDHPLPVCSSNVRLFRITPLRHFDNVMQKYFRT